MVMQTLPEQAPASRRLRIAVLDDHEIVLHGFQSLVGVHGQKLAVVCTATTVRELNAALDVCRKDGSAVDAVLLDLHLADGLVSDADIERLVDRGIPVVVHTSELRPVPIRAAMRAGARGVALKSDPVDLLVEILTEVVDGGVGMTSDLAHVLATEPELVANLTKRELEALQLLSEGVPKQAIGRTMDPPVEASTVNTFLARVMQRYAVLGREVHNVYGAVREATKDGHLSP